MEAIRKRRLRITHPQPKTTKAAPPGGLRVAYSLRLSSGILPSTMRLTFSIAFLAALVPSFLVAQKTHEPDTTAIFEHAKAATVVVLAGEGAGRLNSIATGVVISKDGEILTALHAIKGAAEVQVRMANGEVFDRVEMLGADERRDIAAIKISAGNLPTLTPGNTEALTQGSPVFAVSNAEGLKWSATSGIISAVRPADEVPGAGSGFRLLQFTAPVAPGASGGPLINGAGELIGIITSGKGSAAFAVPIDSVIGLPAAGPRMMLGSGSSLHLPEKQAIDNPQSSATIANVDPAKILKNAKTIYIHSKTSFLTVDTLDRALLLQKDWGKLGLTIVQDPRVADLLIEIDRPLFTYVHTFVIADKRTSIVLGSGKVTAFDGTIASGGLAKDIVKIFANAKLPPPTKK